MSETTTKKKMLPIKIKKTKEAEIPIDLYILSFKWIKREFVNIETGEKLEAEYWTKGGTVPLTRLCNLVGRPIVGKSRYGRKDYKGELYNPSEAKARVYGIKALAQILGAIYPCTEEEAKKLVDFAVKNRMNHAKIVLKSDLVPTSPDRYDGKNEWVIIQNYPETEELEKQFNEKMKRLGSPIRAKFGLKWKLSE